MHNRYKYGTQKGHRPPRQHVLLSSVLNKHWWLLERESKFAPFISQKPCITYKKSNSFRDDLIMSHYKGEKRKDPCTVHGTYKCQNCKYCQYIWGREFTTPFSSIIEECRHFVNCKTEGVVYIMLCECGAFYIGKTSRPFWKRIKEHVNGMRDCTETSPIGRHRIAHHLRQTIKIRFAALERVHRNPRGGNFDNIIV